MLEDRVDLFLGHDHRNIFGPLGPDRIGMIAEILLEHMPEKEEQDIEGLVLRGSGDFLPDGNFGPSACTRVLDLLNRENVSKISTESRRTS